MLDQIVGELKAPVANRKTVPQSEVRKWMESTDVDTLGATYVFLSKPEHVERVVPLLSFDSVFEFMLRYYEFCLRDNPQSKWANSAYSAGHDLVGWFVRMWDEGLDRRYFDIIKSRLSSIYISGSRELKTCIENGIIEHLFEKEPIRNFFSDWKSDPQLRPAFEQGMLWVSGGGRSPLTS